MVFLPLPPETFCFLWKYHMLHLKTFHVVFLMEGAQILERKLHEEDNLGDEDIFWSGEQMFALGFRETPQFQGFP